MRQSIHALKTILLTGAGGQLAADLEMTFASAGHTVIGYRREDLDITDEGAVSTVLKEVRPDIVLNTAAYNKVDAAETDAEAAFAINALGPRVLAKSAHDVGAVLVHYSTDYVVDDGKRTPSREADAPLPRSVYASSKLSGEYFVRSLSSRHYVLRVCGLYGLAGRRTRHGNFVETMLRLAATGRPLRVVADQITAPTATRDVAFSTLALCDGGAPYGLYNCTAEGETSWYDFAAAIFELAGLEVDLAPTTADAYGAAAPRPDYAVLDNSRLLAAGVERPRPWREALSAYLAERGGL